MSVSRKSLLLLVACLAASVTATMVAAQDTTSAPSPAAVVHKSGTTFRPGGNEAVTLTLLVDPNGQVTAFVARSGGTERTLRKVK